MLRSSCRAPLDEDNIHRHRTHTRTSHSQLFFLLFFSFQFEGISALSARPATADLPLGAQQEDEEDEESRV